MSADGSPLSGRSAIITGASQGFGLATAQSFLETGASVCLSARGETLLHAAVEQLSQSVTQPGQRIVYLVADVADVRDCQALVAFAKEALGDVSVLVNNAGVYGPMGPLEDVDWPEWAATIQVNLLGTALMCRAVIPHLRARGGGKIVNLSGGGATAPLPRISAYAASKAAVVRLTETLAEELRDARVDVNAIAPGALNTRLLDQVLAAGPGKVGLDFYQRAVKQHADGGVPLAKGAALAVFLASAASDGITGRLLSAVWDDWANLPARREELAGGDVYTLRRIIPRDRGHQW